MSTSLKGVAIYGDIAMEDIVSALQKSFPNRKIQVEKTPIHADLKLSSNELVLAPTDNSAESKLREQLRQKEQEVKEAEESASKAMVSIQSFHKQQQALFDEFVLLRQRYDEQKSAAINILWTHCAKFHPDLRQIPTQEDPKHFIENDNQVGDFLVGEFLGEGQFATVKDCQKSGENTDYALKIINKDRITSFTALMRVSNEIDNLKLLDNKYIVAVKQVIHTESILYIITEKGGRDLFDFFDEHPGGVPEEWAKRICACILKGVMYCHDQGICHRDLKPENILLEFDSEVGECVDLKLCDFGLSTKFKPKTLLTDFCGSPGFFAPEMIIHGSYFGDKADVWSLGCILLELVAGHEKFCDVWMIAYDYEILQDKAKFTQAIQETVRDLPEALTFSVELNDFIMRFLELRTSKRPSIWNLCSHPWICNHMEAELASRSVRMTSFHGGLSSPSQSRKNMFSESSEVDHKVVETAFGNLSERERKHMEEYIAHHASDSSDTHKHMHLPPITPATPNISGAKKILRKGAALAAGDGGRNFEYDTSFGSVGSHDVNASGHGQQLGGSPSPVAPFSPIGSGHNYSSKSPSLTLPGVTEVDEAESKGEGTPNTHDGDAQSKDEYLSPSHSSTGKIGIARVSLPDAPSSREDKLSGNLLGSLSVNRLV